METRRNRLRWRGYDYSTPGSYYVTLCAQGRRCLFGAVVDGEVRPSAAGRMVIATWRAIPVTFPEVRLAEFVLMPNHLHAILCFLDVAPARRHTLGTVIQWFKYRTTLQYAQGVRTQGWPRFRGRLWQRNFHDRVLRDEDERGHAAGYILRNPRRWHEDDLHPDRR